MTTQTATQRIIQDNEQFGARIDQPLPIVIFEGGRHLG